MRTGTSLNPDDNYIEQIENLSEKFEFVEIAMGEMEEDISELEAEEVKKTVEDKELDLTVHLPFRQPLATSVECFNEAKLEYMADLLDWAKSAGAEKAVLHCNLRHGEEKEVVEEELREQVIKADKLGKEYGIEICFENTPFYKSRPMDLEEFGELLEELDVAMCFDIGHAVAEVGEEESVEFLEEYNHLISHLHIQDTRDERDSHLSLGDGEIDFEAVCEHLQDFDGTACLEIFTEDEEIMELSRKKFLRNF